MKIGIQELIIVLIVVIVIFGPTQIPKLSRMLGKSVRNFKDGMSEAEEPVPPETIETENEKREKETVRNEQESVEE